MFIVISRETTKKKILKFIKEMIKELKLYSRKYIFVTNMALINKQEVENFIRHKKISISLLLVITLNVKDLKMPIKHI